MSKKIEKSRVMTSQVNLYHEQLLSIRKMQESTFNHTAIHIHQSMPDQEVRVNRRAQRMLQAANSQHHAQYQNIEHFIFDNINLDHQKYAQFSEHSEHSSDQEIQLLPYNIQDIVDIANKDPQPGKVLFIVKMIRYDGMEIDFEVENIRPKSNKFKLEAQLVRSFQGFELYEIDFNSIHKKIMLHLVIGKQKYRQRSSVELGFATKAIHLDLGLSYDFQQDKPLEINIFEGLIAACVLEGQGLVDQIIDLNGRKVFKDKLLSSSFKIDKITQEMMNKNNKNKIPLIKLLKFLLDEDEFHFGKPLHNPNDKPNYNNIANIYLAELLKFKPSIGSNQTQLSVPQTIELFQMYLHLICFNEIKLIQIDRSSKDDIYHKIGDIVHYCFQVKEVRLFHNFIGMCISTANFILPIGYDTIRQYIMDYGINSPNYILAAFQNLAYHFDKNKKKMNIALRITQIFKKCPFETQPKLYDNYIKIIKTHSQNILKEITLESLQIKEFCQFYSVFSMFKSNRQLSDIMNIPTLNEQISEYVHDLKEKMKKASQDEKIEIIKFFQIFFIKQRNDELVTQDMHIANWLYSFVDSNLKNDIILNMLIQFYFQMLKRTGTYFTEATIVSTSKNLHKTLSKLTPEKYLTYIDRHFKEDILDTQLFIKILTDCILTPVIQSWLTAKIVDWIDDEKHSQWHHGFKYQLFIKEMIVERVISILNKEMKNDHLTKDQFIQTVKNQISICITDEDQKNTVLAIIQIEEIQLSEEKVWSYFAEKRGLLKTLEKIMKKDDAKTEELRDALRDINDKLEDSQVSFDTVLKIKKMKKNQWHSFCKITTDYDIVQNIEKHYSEGDTFCKYVNQLEGFVRYIGNKFNCSDSEKTLEIFVDYMKKFHKESIKFCKIEQVLPQFKDFKREILQSYKLESFYGETKFENCSVKEIVTASNELLSKLRKYLEMMVKDYQDKTLKSSYLFFFQPKKHLKNQFIQMMNSNFQAIDEIIDEIIQIYDLFTKSEQLEKQLFALITIQQKKFSIKDPVLHEFYLICRQLNKKKDIDIFGIIEKHQNMIRRMKQYKINLDKKEESQILNVFTLLLGHEEIKPLLKQLQPHLGGLKDKINEIGGQVTYQELQNCQYVIEFLQKIWHQEDFNQFYEFIQAIHRFSKQKKEEIKYFNLFQTINSVIISTKNLKEELANFLDSSRQSTKIIDEVVKKVKITLNLNSSKDKIESVIEIYPDGEIKCVPERDLLQTKEKGIMLLASASSQEEKERVKKIPEFLDVCKNFQNVKEKEQKLVDWGYRQFQIAPGSFEIMSFEIEQAKTDILKTQVEEDEQKLKQWKQQVNKIYGGNYKAAHLQGKNIHQFYQFIAKQKSQIPSTFLIIIDKDKSHEDIINHQDFKDALKKNKKNNPIECLKVLNTYFKELKNQQKEQQAEDWNEEFVHLKVLAKDEFDFLRGIEQIGENRINKIEFEHILICTKETHQTEIKSFIERALRDCNNQYILLGFQNLDRKKQQFIIDLITEFKRGKDKDGQFTLKLCLVGNSQIELLYKYAKANLGKPGEKKNIQEAEKAYRVKLQKQTKLLKIVSSEKAGLGKSTYIKKHSEKYKCKRQHHIPLSGEMLVPTDSGELQCQKFLWEKFKSLHEDLIAAEKRRKGDEKIDTCIVLDIYNIEPASVDSVNKFLQNIIFFKKHSYKNMYFAQLPDNVPIYIELQNISSPLNKKSKNNLPPQVNTLPFLKELYEICPNSIREHIVEFSSRDIDLSNKDLPLQYILSFLKCLKDGSINTTFIQPYNKGVKFVEEAKRKELIDLYFFNKFKQNDKPSGYLWTYFKELLFLAVKKFSDSIFLSQLSLQIIDQGLAESNKPLHTSLNLKGTFRGEFLKVLVQNCFEFIQRSVKPGSQGQQSSLQATLMEMPFLIIPNQNEDSFSFIYNKSENVPSIIKHIIVLQETKLLNRVYNTPIQELFETQNIAKLEKTSPEEWKKRATRILRNISGNQFYDIGIEPGYVVNIDNFFKICLISQRMRLNIPIVIMGEAGIGKTALLRHVVKYLYNHELKIFNINAGLPLESVKNENQKDKRKIENSSLVNMVNSIKTTLEEMKEQKAEQYERKLWIFFDEFNTLRELGFFKEIIMDKRFLGAQCDHFKDIVMVAACNPHKKLKMPQNKDQIYTLNKNTDRLAFDVLPAPHSLIQCMWNYGALNEYEYEKYIRKMLSDISYKNAELAKLILAIHKMIKLWLHDSAVSLRDIQRFRQIYSWFLPHFPKPKDKKISPKLGGYVKNKEERSILMALYFTYILRFNFGRREQLEKKIEEYFKLENEYVKEAKEMEQNDFCSRLNLKLDTPLALNDALKQNLYTCFVCVNTRLPLLIIGSPGSSKSLSLRLLTKNLGNSQDQYIKSFKAIRSFAIQGSQNTVSKDIKQVFERAENELYHKKQNNEKSLMKLEELKASLLIVFDEIGLAERSPQNPLKVLHPYLEVNRQSNMNTRRLSFIGISNSELDVSKMSRLLVLRRPPAGKQDLIQTALNIARGYQQAQDLSDEQAYLVRHLTSTYDSFLGKWQAKKNNFPLFYGLRDFYGLIKNFMTKIVQKQIQRDDNDEMIEACTDSIFENFNGWQGSFVEFTMDFFDSINIHGELPKFTMSSVLENIKSTLNQQSNRYPLLIAQDEESLSFIKWILELHFKEKAIYMEGSPFTEEKEYSLKLLGQICKYMEGQFVLILSNLKEGVKTGLYDFFNKSFTVIESTKKKYLRMRINQGSNQNIKSFPYNPKFNCLYLLLNKDLDQVEPPFLSRFQKYKFSLQDYRKENNNQIFKKIEAFSKRIKDICDQSNLTHYQFNDLFINTNKKALESLSMASYEHAKMVDLGKQQKDHEEIDYTDPGYKQSIKRLVLNSGQQFYYLFKFFIEKSGALGDIKDLISNTIAYKNQSLGEKTLVIRFTKEQKYMKQFEDKPQHTCVEYQELKKEMEFQDEIAEFFKKTQKKELSIFMKVLEHSKNLNYVISQIEKIRKRAITLNDKVDDKKIRIVYFSCRDRMSNEGVYEKDLLISHFSGYSQEFDDGKVGDLGGSKEELFKNMIKLEDLLNYVHKVFDFTFDNPENIKTTQYVLKNILNEFENNKNSLFQQNCEEVILKLETNFELSEENIKQILQDKQILSKYKNFKMAITRYFADKKLFGAIAMFIKYLIEKESYLSYSEEFIFKYLESQAFKLSQKEINEFSKLKKSKIYAEFVKEMLKTKTTFILPDYQKLKLMKKLPKPENKYPIKMSKPRLVPFSKVECMKLLDCSDKNPGMLAKQVYKDKDKIKQNYQLYVEQLKRLTTFKNARSNFYDKFVDQNAVFRKMLFFDFLQDFCQLHGLSIKFIPKFFQLMELAFSDFQTYKFTKMVSILLSFEEIWIQVFKIASVFYVEDCDLALKIKKSKQISEQSMKKYCQQIFHEINDKLLDQSCRKQCENVDKYTRLYFNALFQMQKLEPMLNIQVSSQLKSIRASLVFLEIFDPNSKSEKIDAFINEVNKSKMHFSHYHIALEYFDILEQEATNEQIKMINEFKANTLFFEWFKKKNRGQEKRQCLDEFIKNCQNQTFAHNSAGTLNYFVQTLTKLKYSKIIQSFQKLNVKQKREDSIQQVIFQIGQHSKKHNFKDNLSIVMINMFMQKINAEFQNINILNKNLKQFQEIIQLISTQESYGVSKHFAFAFIKVFLEKYINHLSKDEEMKQFSKIDEILSKKDNQICSNLRFYCLKLLRTKLPLKQIQKEYQKKKKCSWILQIDEIDFFFQNESRSLIIPKPHQKGIQKLKEIIQGIIEQGGKPDNFEHLFNQGCISSVHRYHLLTFFFRYYFSLVYSYKAYKQQVIDHLTKQRNKYSNLIGQIQFQLIMRYANSHFDDHMKIQDPLQFTEEKFFIFNPINWLLATRDTTSPFNSIFFDNNRFHNNFVGAFDNLFFPCGPENPFINIAQSQSQLTRNSKIGVYICSNHCDYIYSHQDCGWPSESTPCRVCGQLIGAIPGKSHTLNRADQGARRVMSPKVVDNWNFYISSLVKLNHYNECQRCYIEGEINRMKKNGIVKHGKNNINLKGYQVVNQGRVSSLTYYVFRQILHSIFYGLCSLKVIPPDQAVTIFKAKDQQDAKKILLNLENQDIAYIKKALQLDTKIYGWIYGIHNQFFDISRRFKDKFDDYVGNITKRADNLADLLMAEITKKNLSKCYHDLYTDMSNSLKNGLISKQISSITDMTARNRFTRDTFEELLEKFISVNTTEQKFKLSESSSILQGTMQYPNDCILTQDKIEENKYQFSKVLKIPDKIIVYSQIVVAYELLIREKYPFLDYILKNSETINNMGDFYTILTFANQLFLEVQNTYERKDAERMLGQFMKQLKDKKGNKLPQIFNNPEAVIEAWNRLAKKLGTLQNNCTVVGKMNDEYSLTQTPVKAFLLDNVSKTNPYGLILSSLYHNFAIMHNDLMNLLNSRKNQIPQYKCLNLYNDSKKISPQRIKQKEIFYITEKELIDKLYEFSISSISYGRNFIFTNFQSYQRHFLMKLQGKCQILSNIPDFKSICFNGQAFAQTSQTSNTLTQIRQYFYKPLDDKQRNIVHRAIKWDKTQKQIAECSVKVRGDIEKIMIAIRNLNGVVQEANISQFISKNNIQYSSPELMEFDMFNVSKIVPLYELVELQMRQSVIETLPDRYKNKLNKDVQTELLLFFRSLPVQQSEYGVSLLDFGQALYRFIARNLQSGLMDDTKKIMEYLPYRQDFWKKDFEDYMLGEIMNHQILCQLTLEHICAVFQIVQDLIQKSIGQSKI